MKKTAALIAFILILTVFVTPLGVMAEGADKDFNTPPTSSKSTGTKESSAKEFKEVREPAATQTTTTKTSQVKNGMENIVSDGQYYYYLSGGGLGTIYRKPKDGSSGPKVLNPRVSVRCLNLYNGYLYFKDYAGDNTMNECVYRMKTDGTGFTKLYTAKQIYNVTIMNNKLYVANQSDDLVSGRWYKSQLNTMDLNGKNVKSVFKDKQSMNYFLPVGDTLYIMARWGFDTNMFAVNTKTDKVETLFDEEFKKHGTSNMQYYNGEIYFSATPIGSDTSDVYKVSTKGGKPTKVNASYEAHSMVFVGNTVYYNIKNNLYRTTIGGGKGTKIGTLTLGYFSYHEGIIYDSNWEDGRFLQG